MSEVPGNPAVGSRSAEWPGPSRSMTFARGVVLSDVFRSLKFPEQQAA